MAKGKDEKEKAEKPLVVCICGMAGSGKSALAKKLAEKYALKYYSGGDALKALAIEEGYAAVNRGWWESAEGLRFLKKRGKEQKFDEAVDKKLMKLAHQGNIVLDSWTMPWLLNCGFKMWLDASLKKRAERVALRDGISLRDALDALRCKERQTKAIYKKLYGFTLGEDFSPFHLILDTDHLNSDEVFEVLCTVVDKLLLGHDHNWFSQNAKN